MLASSQNIENAFIYADKALAFAFGRRLQSIGKHQKVGLENFLSIPTRPNESFSHRLHDHRTLVIDYDQDTNKICCSMQLLKVLLICSGVQHTRTMIPYSCSCFDVSLRGGFILKCKVSKFVNLRSALVHASSRSPVKIERCFASIGDLEMRRRLI